MGDPGIGKSTLLAYAAKQGADMHVLRAVGVESVVEPPFVGLHRLLWPVLDHIPHLASPQAAALRGAFGLEATPGDRFLVAVALLALHRTRPRLARVFRDGGLAETVVVPEFALPALPARLDVKDACLIEPASVAWHGVRRAQLQPGERFLVVGGGSLGLLAAAAAQHLGFDADVEARYDHQRAAAERMRFGRPSVYDAVLDAAGKESSLARCAQAARPGGRIVSLGVYQTTMPIPGTVLVSDGVSDQTACRSPTPVGSPRTA